MQGNLQDTSVVDLVQQNCQAFATARITLWDKERKAFIFIDAGQVSHAMIGDHQGEVAFFKILEWTSGEFLLEPGVKSPFQSIYRKWSSLIHGGPVHEESDEYLEEIEPSPADEATPRARLEKDIDFVRQLTSIQGVVGSLVVAEDGTVLAHTMEDSGEKDGAIAVFVGGAAVEYGEALSIGSFEHGVVTIGKRSMLVLAWEEYFVGLLFEEDTSPRSVVAQASDLLARFK
ncbi:MAG: DUF4388 domain-containing protein [Anaerolineales bacterium]|nr:DUF4388 domain-containing protein [Anaerolineales bacterium]